jgi:hypothetical protein
MIELKLLIEKTIEVLKEQNIFDPIKDKCAIRNDKSVWGSIFYKCNGFFDKLENLAIRTKWIRNGQDYRNSVLKKLSHSNTSTRSSTRYSNTSIDLLF